MKYWIIISQAIVLLCATDATATTYYVDYDQGDDTQVGTSEASAWKHAPGDKNAVGTVQAAVLIPGDTVLLKGGVTYRGSIAIPASGKAENPVTYKGDGWGQDKAVVDGSAPFGGKWTQCASAEELRGNTNYRSIHYTDAPEGYRFTSGTYENGRFVYPAQDPAPGDPFHFDRIDQLRVIPKDDPAVSQTNSSITDPRHFTSGEPSFYDGASVLVWHTPNVTRLYRVTGFDPATHTIHHEKVGGGGIYKGRDTYYAIINHPVALSGPGQYWLDEETGRFHVWPYHGAAGDNEYSTVAAETGIDAGGRQHVVIEGFIVQKFVFGVRAGTRDTSDVVIRNNEVRNLKSNEKYAIHVSGANMQVIDNRVTDCHRAVGILAGGKNIVIRDNTVERSSRQGIWLMGVEHGQVIGNRVVDVNGTHANGISVYLYFKDVLIAGNRVLRTGSALTYHGTKGKSQASEGLTIYNNLVDGAANRWAGEIDSTTIANNTFLGAANVGGDVGRQVFVNNIAHSGGKGTVRSHNLYTDLAWWQKPGQYDWSLADGEINWSDKSRDDIFADQAKRDYRLKAGSPALGTGTDPGKYLPVDVFPDYDFSKDIEGRPHVRDGRWSIGAYVGTHQ